MHPSLSYKVDPKYSSTTHTPSIKSHVPSEWGDDVEIDTMSRKGLLAGVVMLLCGGVLSLFVAARDCVAAKVNVLHSLQEISHVMIGNREELLKEADFYGLAGLIEIISGAEAL